jgi:type VI secretion system secreted protein VgrG
VSKPFRPPRETEKPAVPGVLTATVESAGGDYAYVDDEGRYRARFHFDDRNERSDGTRTLPIRLTQPYTGPEYGMHFPNHAETELVIAFENGDIDRPIALGTVPNAANPSPTVATNKMENILRTYGGNELLMDDTTDETHVALQSANDHELQLDDEHRAVRLVSTDNHEIRLDDDERRIEIRSREGRRIVLDDENEEIRIATDEGPSLRLSDGDETVSVTDAEERHVLTLDYANEAMHLDTEGDIVLAADGAMELRSASLSIDTDEGAEVSVGGNLTQTAQGNVKLEGQENVTVEAGRTLTGTAGSKVEISARQIVQSAGAQMDVTATTLAMEGSGLAEIKGGIVKVNG